MGSTSEDLKGKFGRRIQRCYGCFIAYYLKDMWLGEGGTFFCEDCRDEGMFHFDEFSEHLDLSQLPSLQPESDA